MSASLTLRQREICDLIIRGRTNPEIAAVLGLATNTVKTYLQEVYAKLGVANRTELAALLTRQAVLPPRSLPGVLAAGLDLAPAELAELADQRAAVARMRSGGELARHLLETVAMTVVTMRGAYERGDTAAVARHLSRLATTTLAVDQRMTELAGCPLPVVVS